MKKTGKTVLSYFSGFSFLSVVFWWAIYYLGGLSYLYYNKEVVKHIFVFFTVVILLLILLIAIIMLMYRSKKAIRIICTILLVIFIPASLYGALIGMLVTGVITTNGCSFTEDIANYGKYDYDFKVSHFPETITSDMNVVNFRYFYKYSDADQIDVFLEVKFENKEIMNRYLTTAKKALSNNGVLTYQNPYNSKYTDIVENTDVLLNNEGKYASFIEFKGDDDYKYVHMRYNSITYSYEELTILYNHTSIGSDIETGNNPNNGEYYPKYLERFGVEWNHKNNFKYEYVGV